MQLQRLLPPDLPERAALALEVHARPSETLAAPARASHVAVLIDADARDEELEHLRRLCRQCHVSPPLAGDQQWSGNLGALRMVWERHGEFSTYTVLVAGHADAPFAQVAAARLPSGWLAGLPGSTVHACHAEILPAPTGQDIDWAHLQQSAFGGNLLVASEIGGGVALACSDFRLHVDGFGRCLLFDCGMDAMLAGRMLQRLLEIEVYRMMALLAFPMARRLSPRIQAIEQSLAALTDDIARAGSDTDDDGDATLLAPLTRLAAEVESGLSASQFRFGACRAYAELVRTRIEELRERRLPGHQSIGEFMARRFTPAVATVATVSQRLHDLSERVSQASHLLSTRVGIASERQNNALLASMDRRARLQLRLQQTVEGLSVAAIVYYLAGVVGYLVKGGEALGLPLNTPMVVGLSVPLFALFALFAVRRARRHAHDSGAD
ncbi:DUF3422 family protein [uncultured Pseudacidovorax sp.]|uniref:DUF3422 family protein n=1 Tax=uncultured Pseudacidovorax sp. TaxID=679313 RepID=UPI0025EC827F|nr:DUF3422 domain-containing protein [uncultured Pseudacidovorax sp.]